MLTENVSDTVHSAALRSPERSIYNVTSSDLSFSTKGVFVHQTNARISLYTNDFISPQSRWHVIGDAAVIQLS